VPVQYSYTSTPPMDLTASKEPQCLYGTAIPLLPLWTVRPYRALVPVQYSYTSTPSMDRTASTEPQCLYSRAIPLLPLWAVRPVQSLTACTVELYFYSPYGPYRLYRASVPVQYSYTSTPLSAYTVQLYLYSPYWPYGLYRASVSVQYSCTSTPLSTCTVQLYLYSPQCLYSRAIPLLLLWAVRPVQSLSPCTRVHFTFVFGSSRMIRSLYKGQQFKEGFLCPLEMGQITFSENSVKELRLHTPIS